MKKELVIWNLFSKVRQLFKKRESHTGSCKHIYFVTSLFLLFMLLCFFFIDFISLINIITNNVLLSWPIKTIKTLFNDIIGYSLKSTLYTNYYRLKIIFAH